MQQYTIWVYRYSILSLVYHDTAIYCTIQSSVNLELFSEITSSQPSCTTAATVVCISIHFDGDTSIYHDIRYIDTT